MNTMRAAVVVVVLAAIAACEVTPDLGIEGRGWESTPVETQSQTTRPDTSGPLTGEIARTESSRAGPFATHSDVPTTATKETITFDIAEALDALDAVEQMLDRFENDVESIELEEEGVNP